ncbi:MAG TPA: hypothetical protein VN706_22830 [Gemmatimonadaceae bacterium]|nr:hypothetical protein [Gemmatimonadaceae bacterium]
MRKLLPVALLAVAALLSACGSDSTAPGGFRGVTPTTATSLAVGSSFVCVVTATAVPFCWGNDAQGQLGDSSTTNKSIPSPLAGGHSFVAISAGSLTACGLNQNGAVWCWGEDPNQPGVTGAIVTTPSRVAVPVPLVSITVGRKFGCGLSSAGTAYCWGENGRGQLGAGDTLKRTAPVVIPGNLQFRQISAGFWHACGILLSGDTYCWGDNQYAELATGETNTQLSATPRRISGNVAFASLASGSVHTCGLATDGTAYCWGNNFSGQLGDGTSSFHLSPTAVVTNQKFTLLRATRANDIFSHTCGITGPGDVYCWGLNSHGELGAVTSTDGCINASGTTQSETCAYTPVKVPGISNVKMLDVGDANTCAINTASQLFCWGNNFSGQLGNGSFTNSTTPVLVNGSLKLP